jgi:HlyD family secretion protein
MQSQLQKLVSQQVAIAQQEIETEATRRKQIQEVQREIIRLEMQLNTKSQIVSEYSGRILEVIATPGQVISPGTRLATVEAENTQSKLVGVTYFPVGEGKKIHPGMSIQINPEAVKRNFGGIVGTVTNISQLPITKDAAANKLGNPAIVEALVSQKQKGLIQVVSELNLDPNTPSGYKWSASQGPNLQISPGTTTVVRAKVEERAPISFVLPMLKSDVK